MTREEQLKSCTICTHRCMDMHKGLLCGLTQNAANFEGVCPNFEQDEKEAKKQQQIQQEVKNDEVMNDKDQTNYWLLASLCILFYVFGGTIITMLQNMSPLFIFFIALLFGVPAFCFVYKFVENYLVVPYDVRRFEKRVIKLLNKEGYKWERAEGDLYIFKDDIRFRIKLERLQRPAIRVFFECHPLYFKLVNRSSLIKLTDIPVDIVDIIALVFVKGNDVVLFYRADIRSASEFMQELEYAYYRCCGEILLPVL